MDCPGGDVSGAVCMNAMLPIQVRRIYAFFVVITAAIIF